MTIHPFPHDAKGQNAAGNAAGFSHVDTWVFDLDNTLYPAGSPLWPQIDQRITLFLVDLFGIDGLSARALQKYYYTLHGTTLRGLIHEGVVDPHKFLDFVHDIDRSSLLPNPQLAAAIAALPGRKLILTNGSHFHAMRTAERLGIDHLFEDAFDIVAADFVPKPDAAVYEAFFVRHGVDPAKAAMFEDLPQNLVVPAKRGMKTVLVVPNALPVHAMPDYIDYVTDDLTAFLRSTLPLHVL